MVQGKNTGPLIFATNSAGIGTSLVLREMPQLPRYTQRSWLQRYAFDDFQLFLALEIDEA